MAKIYLSYSRKDAEFAHALDKALMANGHQPVLDTIARAPGQDWRSIFAEGLKTADAFVVLISQPTLSQHSLWELGTARTYASSVGKPAIISVAIEPLEVPLALRDIDVLFAEDKDINRIVREIDRAIAASEGRAVAREKKAKEVAQKIQLNAVEYIGKAVAGQQRSEQDNKRAGRTWHFIGFAALLLGIAFVLVSINLRPAGHDWMSLTATLVTNVIVIGFLGACSRYAFALGKSYISESLKASDRLHAIAFGEFYLNAFGGQATWNELKEVFQHWNIDRTSTFSGLDASQIDPQILALIGQFASSIGGQAKSKEKG
jgi:hypothetical protein